MAKRTTLGREWTATEIHKLKGLAKKKVEVEKIARALKRTVAATTVKASLVGVSLESRPLNMARPLVSTDEFGREEGQRDGHIDMPDAAFLALRDLFEFGNLA
jgi:hypothetical protein